MKRMLFCLLFGILTVFVFSQTSVLCAAQAAGDKSSPVATSQSASGGEYIIGKGDVLDISVWREPMLSGEAVVRNDGMISVALLGDVNAAGRTPADLKNEIQQRLKEFVAQPAVTVIVKTPGSQMFYVIGEVKTPGEYPLIKDLTIVQAIARAGGFTEWASKDKILLLRKENGVEKRIRINYNDIVSGKQEGRDLTLKVNDTIVVP